ncbi:MAG: V-type ATP synthase subunit F [Theionarchaea archaeon]|nr:V-type ATP synthase subunit F [Theionarchaea archaeon]MBU7038429.1 V-type ATP synthase subunit F [Theionarchaea archaeon]
MNKIAMISDRETGLIFKNMGIDSLEAETPDMASALLREHAKEYGIIFITEDLAVQIAGTIEEYASSSLPAVIEIPSFEGPKGLGKMKMRRICEKAAGADILFKEE